MDPLVIILAFACGFLASRINLPPLVGYLVAGFVLSMLGYHSGPVIRTVADTGVTILLFTIGLKLRVRSLLRPEVWAGATLHMLVTVTLFSLGILALAASGPALFSSVTTPTALLLAFALSFSSTVFAVKILDESGRAGSLNGRTAIGILIVQDIFAVLFLTFSTGKIPSPWALAVIALLPAARWLFSRILDRIGHGELQVLFGFFLALSAGAEMFDLVGLKADLGALIMGMLLASHERTGDMAKALYGFKDFLLVGFFLEIGLAGLPSMQALGAALIFMTVLPLKAGLFFLVLNRFRLRARTSFITSLNLTSYSEFGLIVGGMAVASGWLDRDWLLAIAVALSLSFVIASPFNKIADTLFDRLRAFLERFETKEHHPDEEPYQPGTWQIGVIGMGRAGTGAYDFLTERFGPVVLGIDFDAEKVDRHQEAGRQVGLADITDPDFWRRVSLTHSRIKIVILTLPALTSQLFVVEQLRKRGFKGDIASVARYDDEVEILREAGVKTAFNLYAEAGLGLGAHLCETMDLSDLELAARVEPCPGPDRTR
jgi:predicted Kef-type K+ transport protein